MKKIRKDNVGLRLIIIGLIIWLVPFTLVAIDNVIGATRPADSLINNAGVFIIMASPVLILAGLIIMAINFFKRTKA
jgi:hypothetical protein